MTEILELTMEEMLRIELHYSDQRNLKSRKHVMEKDQELLKNKAQIAQLIAKVAELELQEKVNQASDFGQIIKNHQDSYEKGHKQQIKDRLGIKDDETFSYSADTLEVTIRKAEIGPENTT